MQAIARREGVNAIDARICAGGERGNGTISGDPPRSQQCFALADACGVGRFFSEVVMGSIAGEISTVSVQNAQEVLTQSNSKSSIHSQVSIVPTSQKVVSPEVLTLPQHQKIRDYINNSRVRNAMSEEGLNSLIMHASGVLENRPAHNTTYGGLLKDFSMLKAAVADVCGSNSNAKYVAQKAVTRTVWNNMPGKPSGVPGVLQTLRSLVRTEQPKPVFPPADLRDTVISELGSLVKWAIPTGPKGFPEPSRTMSRQQEIVRRSAEVLPNLYPRQQAEVVAAMVAASVVVPGALDRAVKWIEKNRDTNQDLELVFNEIVKLCMEPATCKKALGVLGKFVSTIKTLSSRRELYDRLSQDVMLKMDHDDFNTSDIARLQTLANQIR